MENFIFERYKYAQLVPTIKEISAYCYSKRIEEVKSTWEEIVPIIKEYCTMLKKKEPVLATELMNAFEEACSNTRGPMINYNLMGDKLLSTLPLLYKSFEKDNNINVSDGFYNIFSSRSGFLTLKNLSSGQVYHSILDPVTEARERAKQIYLSSYTAFHFIGCGLGYLPWEIFCLSDMSIDVFVHHIDVKLVQYALDYGYLSFIPEDKLHIIIHEDMDSIQTVLDQFEFNSLANGFSILEDICDLASPANLFSLARFSIFGNTHSAFSKFQSINLWRNIKNVPDTIFEIEQSDRFSEWIVIVAGPSLDQQLEYIKNSAKKCKTVCASTVLKKLLDIGIIPDYVCVCDPQPRTYNHFIGIESFASTLLLESTSNWRFGEYYRGKKYLVPSSSCSSSLYYYAAKGIKTFQITGSVAYMCVSMAWFLGATTIHLCGMDLAYPGEKSHADNTMDNHDVQSSSLISIPCVNGNSVLTSMQFKIYIDSMNELFGSMKGVKIINHSDIGASFSNTVWYKDTE